MTSPYPPQNPYPPQPGYPPQGYAPQGYAQPAPGYAPPAPGYPPQGYAPQAQYAPPTAPPIEYARGTIEDFLDQAGGGGQSVTKFFTDQRVNGHWLQLQIARDLLQSDVRPQLDNNKQQARDQQGRLKWVLVIQCQVIGSSDGAHTSIFPDGACSIWLKGLTKEGLVSAMSTAGVSKPDMALLNGNLGGAQIVMQSAGTRAARTSGFSAAKLYNFQYTPNGRENADPTGLQQTAQAASPIHNPGPAQSAPPQTVPAPTQYAPPTMPAAPAAAPMMDPTQYAQQIQSGYAPAAPPAPSTPPMPPTPGAPVPGAPNGYAPAPTQQYQQAPPAPQQYAQQPQQPGYATAPQIPLNGAPNGAPPAPPQGFAPPTDPEKAATLARLQGLGG